MTTGRENYQAGARARRVRATKKPSKAAIEAALALIRPLGEGLYRRMAGKIDVDRLLRARKKGTGKKHRAPKGVSISCYVSLSLPSPDV